jgi:hypothetical protein
MNIKRLIPDIRVISLYKYRKTNFRGSRPSASLNNSPYIQGDSGGLCTTWGNDSMSDFKQKSSYEHGSDFERLRSYDRLKLGIEGNDY